MEIFDVYRVSITPSTMVYYISRLKGKKSLEFFFFFFYFCLLYTCTCFHLESKTLNFSTRLFEWDELKNIIAIIAVWKRKNYVFLRYFESESSTILNYFCKHHVVRGQGQKVIRNEHWRISHWVVFVYCSIGVFFYMEDLERDFHFSLGCVVCVIDWF